MTTEAAGRVVVADAGPLLHLDELDALDVLSDLGEILVPPAVHRELLQHRPSLPQRCPQLKLLAAVPAAPTVDALTPLYTLHHGEREALACCLGLPSPLLLTDDTAARLAAQTLMIRAHGTLGLLVRAVRQQLRPAQDVVALLEAVPGALHLAYPPLTAAGHHSGRARRVGASPESAVGRQSHWRRAGAKLAGARQRSAPDAAWSSMRIEIPGFLYTWCQTGIESRLCY